MDKIHRQRAASTERPRESQSSKSVGFGPIICEERQQNTPISETRPTERDGQAHKAPGLIVNEANTFGLSEGHFRSTRLRINTQQTLNLT